MPNKPPARGARSQQVGRAGEYFVVAELNKRGAYAVAFAGNMPKIDLMACNHDQSRTIHIQVKTKRGGRSWHSSTKDSKPMSPPASPLDETNFWAFVDLGDVDVSPRYWIVPDWWMRNDIYEAHQAYLANHGGTLVPAIQIRHTMPSTSVGWRRGRIGGMCLGFSRSRCGFQPHDRVYSFFVMMCG